MSSINVFVLCPSPTSVFDKWHAFLPSLETLKIKIDNESLQRSFDTAAIGLQCHKRIGINQSINWFQSIRERVDGGCSGPRRWCVCERESMRRGLKGGGSGGNYGNGSRWMASIVSNTGTNTKNLGTRVVKVWLKHFSEGKYVVVATCLAELLFVCFAATSINTSTWELFVPVPVARRRSIQRKVSYTRLSQSAKRNVCYGQVWRWVHQPFFINWLLVWTFTLLSRSGILILEQIIALQWESLYLCFYICQARVWVS